MDNDLNGLADLIANLITKYAGVLDLDNLQNPTPEKNIEDKNKFDMKKNRLSKSHSTKFKLIDEIDNLDVEDKHYKRRKNDLDDSLYRMYDTIEELEGQLIEALIAEIQIYEEKQPNLQWLKSITFKFPIIDEDLNIDLDNNEQVECIALLVRDEATAK